MHLYTVFEDRPTKSVISMPDGTKKELILYQKSTGLKLKEIHKRVKLISRIIKSKKVILNDYINYMRYFDINPFDKFSVFDCPHEDDEFFNSKPALWMKLLADVQRVYRYIEMRGLYDGYEKLDFKFGLTSTGRGRCTGINVQGMDSKAFLRTPVFEYDYYINLDWIAADIRYAAICSGDKHLLETWDKSDPYHQLQSDLGIDRDDAKIRILKGIYSLSFNDEVFEAYPDFMDWLNSRSIRMHKNGGLETCLGRKFSLDHHNSKSVFSGMISGSVAHAMQNVLSKIFNMCPQNLLIDMHDSVILVSKRSELLNLINKVRDIMLYPFDGIWDKNPRFPFKIQIGNTWRGWKLYKEVR